MLISKLKEMDKSLLAKLVLFHTFIIALSNYLVTIKFSIFDIKLTWAAFTFPLIVVATDLTVRLVNKENARAIVALSFIPAIIASVLGAASGCAYLVSNLLDVYVFQQIRERMQMWFWAPAISAVFANIIDTFTFFFVAFYQSANQYMADNWLAIAWGQTGVKVAVSLAVILPVYGLLLAYLQKKLERPLLAKVESN
jgi:uncharacterized PurR-regulated membrane protein YhhQ (DUF165 family)